MLRITLGSGGIVAKYSVVTLERILYHASEYESFKIDISIRIYMPLDFGPGLVGQLLMKAQYLLYPVGTRGENPVCLNGILPVFLTCRLLITI